MRINKIILENFRPFYGRQDIDLTTDDRKPLIIIRALNDVGKTSLFKAFQWCLYGGKNKKENASQVNRSAAFKSRGRMSVTLLFTHDKDNYQIRRSMNFLRAPFGDFPEVLDEELTVIKNNQTQTLVSLPEQNEYIEAILPREASQFFLFDGEQIQEYTKRRPGEKVKEAIEMVLGIKELRNARDDLEKIRYELDNELDNLLLKKTKNEKEAQEISDLGDRITDLRSRIDDYKHRIEQAQDNINYCDEQLLKFAHIQEKVEERIKVRKDYDETITEIENNEKEQTNFNENFGFLLFSPLLLKISESGGKQLSTWKRAAMTALLLDASEMCICKRPITDKIRDDFQNQLNKRKSAYLQHIGTEAEQIIIHHPSKFLEEQLYNLSADRTDLESSLKLYEQLKSDLDKEIGEYANLATDIKAIEETRARASGQFEEFQDINRRLEIELESLINEYTSRRNKLTKQMQMDKDIEEKNIHLESAEQCKKAIEYVIEDLVLNNKESVEKLASNVFLKLTNAPTLYQGIDITDEYEIKIKTRGGTIRNVWEQAPSAGQSQIISMAFISALNAYTAREAPVIIDTPIGRLDPIHKKNLINFFSEIGPQVIILYQPSEMGDKDIVPISKFIFSEWELKRDLTDPDTTLIKKLGD